MTVVHVWQCAYGPRPPQNTISPRAGPCRAETASDLRQKSVQTVPPGLTAAIQLHSSGQSSAEAHCSSPDECKDGSDARVCQLQVGRTCTARLRRLGFWLKRFSCWQTASHLPFPRSCMSPQALSPTGRLITHPCGAICPLSSMQCRVDLPTAPLCHSLQCRASSA